MRGSLRVLWRIDLISLEKVHGFTESLQVLHPRLLSGIEGKGQHSLVSLGIVVAEQRDKVGAGVVLRSFRATPHNGCIRTVLPGNNHQQDGLTLYCTPKAH